MTVTIEEARQFITDATKCREEWLSLADKSWREIKKRGPNNKARNTGRGKKSARYPAWYSIYKIRQPLVLSRVGIPVGRDSTQDGNDNVGATAALLKERLAVSLAKSFDFFDVISTCRDDFLATDFATARGYYERDEVKQRVKEYIQVEGEGDAARFVDSGGNPIDESSTVLEDDEGKFIYHNQVVDIENERVCLEPVLYKYIYVDPDIRRFKRCKRLAFEEYYSKPEFIEIFGKQAYAELVASLTDKGEVDNEAKVKQQNIRVFEYWDAYDKDVFWFADYGDDFLKPQAYLVPQDDDSDGNYEREAANGLYDLEQLFPCVPPLMVNAPTDEFWPVPEHFQLGEIFEDIHTIFSRMVALTKAIRGRLLYDSNVEGLQPALNEANESDAFGVPNLAQALSGVGGNLDAVTQYVNVKPLVESLTLVSQALEQRLNTIYRLTGTSDLLQGQTDQTERTYGEQQMKEKYALNQLAERQRKMQEFVRDCYELLCEMALKNFKDASLDMYMMPQTLQDDHKNRYRAAVGMLREDNKRFRIELETDSTIALNEQYDKAMRIEMVNTMTAALKDTAGVAESQPALIVPILHSLKYLIQGFRQGKMFQNEVTEAIDNVIKQSEEAAKNAKPAFDKDEVGAQLKQQEMAQSAQLEQMKLQATSQIEFAKLQQNERIAGLEAQMEQMKLGMEGQKNDTAAHLQWQKIQGDFAIAQQDLANKRDELMLKLQEITDSGKREEMRLMMEASFNASEIALKQAAQRLEETYFPLELQERVATEQRLQEEHHTNQIAQAVDMAAKVKEIHTVEAPEAPKPQPAPKKKQAFEMKRDAKGNLVSVKVKNEQG
jgi:hypothetical protein